MGDGTTIDPRSLYPSKPTHSTAFPIGLSIEDITSQTLKAFSVTLFAHLQIDICHGSFFLPSFPPFPLLPPPRDGYRRQHSKNLIQEPWRRQFLFHHLRPAIIDSQNTPHSITTSLAANNQ